MCRALGQTGEESCCALAWGGLGRVVSIGEWSQSYSWAAVTLTKLDLWFGGHGENGTKREGETLSTMRQPLELLPVSLGRFLDCVYVKVGKLCMCIVWRWGWGRCAHECRCPQTPEEGIKPPRPGGCCEQLMK